MKLIANTLLCLLIMSCGQIDIKKDEQPQRKMDKYLDELFVSEYANYDKNEMVREKATVALKKTIDTLFKKKYLEDIPLKVFKVRKNKNGKGAIVQFYADNENDDDLLSSKLGFDIIGLMSEELASTLEENDYIKYYIYGHNYNRATKAMAQVLVGMTYYATNTEIESDSYSIGNQFKIGVFICEIDSIKLDTNFSY